jgi:hypothetical protein
MFVGSLVSGAVVSHYTATDGTHAWNAIWMIPAAMAAIVLVLFAMTFKEDQQESVPSD